MNCPLFHALLSLPLFFTFILSGSAAASKKMSTSLLFDVRSYFSHECFDWHSVYKLWIPFIGIEYNLNNISAQLIFAGIFLFEKSNASNVRLADLTLSKTQYEFLSEHEQEHLRVISAHTCYLHIPCRSVRSYTVDKITGWQLSEMCILKSIV